jgi:enoyl-CoA hydratase/carnithine racemase
MAAHYDFGIGDNMVETSGSVIVEHRGSVLVATMSNPPLAVMDLEIVEQLGELVRRVDRDPSVGGVVLTGAHPDRFIAHYDVAELLQNARSSPSVRPGVARKALSMVAALRKLPRADQLLKNSPAAGLRFAERFHEVTRSIQSSSAVWVAAINGSALGGGCELALACDVRIACAGAHVIGQPEIMLGIMPGGGATQRLTRMLGPARALRIMLEGVPLTPEQALEVGLVDQLVDAEQLMTVAVAEAMRLGSRPKAAVGALKRAVYHGGSMRLDRGLRFEASEFVGALGTQDALQAMQAYVDLTGRLYELPAYDSDVVSTTLARGRFG